MKNISPQEIITFKISVADLRNYLELNGWRRVSNNNEKILVYDSSNYTRGDVVKIIFPSSNNYSDFAQRVSEALNTLSDLERQDPYKIIDNIISRTRDKFLFWITGPQNSSTSISLEEAAITVTKLKELISYSASVETSKKPYLAKTAKVSKEVLSKCSFGHTVSGSFGFKVLMPELPPHATPSGLLPEYVSPFERRITERIYKGLAYTKKAVELQSTDFLVEKYEEGLNANMCDKLIDIFQDNKYQTGRCSVDWSPEWPIDTELIGHESINIEERSLYYLEEASRQLRTSLERQRINLIGRIIQLRSEDLPFNECDNHEDRIITVLSGTEGALNLKVRIMLPAEDYITACDAHKRGKSISIIGTLEKIGRTWTLTSHTDFKIIDEANQSDLFQS
jgi:hypothetical protein